MSAPRCPTPGKVGYRDELAARLALAKLRRARSSSRDERRVYRCPCHLWHLTSQPPRRKENP